MMGDWPATVRHAADCRAAYDIGSHRTNASKFGMDSLGFALTCEALALCFMGLPDQAVRAAERAQQHAQAVGHPFTYNWTLVASALLFNLRGEWRLALRAAEEALAYATEQEFLNWMLLSRYTRGLAWASVWQPAEGLAEAEEAVAAWRGVGAQMGITSFLGDLASLHLKAGNTGEAFALLEQAEEAARRSGEHFYDAEIWRLRGELLKSSDVAASETALLRAIEVSRQQGGLLFELRSVVSIARLWQETGRKADALHLLSSTMAKMNEGFETADYVAAAALARELR
jgi:tetratricopeptide (TPR) repeat protein